MPPSGGISLAHHATWSSSVSSKIPPEIDGIQVNFCKNPVCANYGVPATLKKFAHRSKASTLLPGTEYTLTGGSKTGTRSLVCLKCQLCGELPPIKSNLGIAEEVERLSSYLWVQREASCPNPACLNHGVVVSAGKLYYYSYGKSEIGSQRYQCRACSKTFSIGKSTRRQRLTHKNKDIFMALMNRVPFNRICELNDIRMQTLYDKMDFFHRQCLSFASNRERRLMDGMPLPKLYIAVDRQDYMVNWSQRKDKRNIVFQAVGSADMESSYVFGMNLNFDPELDLSVVDLDATACGDYSAYPPFRRFARLWLKPDYSVSVARSAYRKRKRIRTLVDEIEQDYARTILREDIEASEEKTYEEALPQRGIQVHAEYTLYAHFFHLQRLLSGAGKLRFFLDQDTGIRAACLAAFQKEIKGRTADAFSMSASRRK